LGFSGTDSGGPEVTRPATPGFGTVIIERSIAHELGGSVQIEFEPGGLRCHLRIPLR
jgi:two-component sensor histidine kinase